MDELDFDFEGPLASQNKSLSQESTNTGRSHRSTGSKGSSRTSSSSRRKYQAGGQNVNESFSSAAASTTDQSKLSQDSSKLLLRRRQQQQHSHEENFEDEMASTVSSSSSKESASTATALSTTGISVVRSKNQATSVRGGKSGVYAAQDAGNFQMLHDECAFLCSTILSRRRQPSKAIDAMIDLVTMLASRKTRAILWQGGLKEQDDSPEIGRNRGSTSSDSPKLWRSLFEIIAVMTQQDTEFSPRAKQSQNRNDNKPSANGILKIGSPPRARTKAARNDDASWRMRWGNI
jgi:hypothetical protein